MERLWMDVRQAWRAWRRVPGVALAMIILPALGMGGVAALFSPLYSIVLAPLPFPHSAQLVRIGGDIPLFSSYATAFEERERLASIFPQVMAYGPVPEGPHGRLATTGRAKDVKVQAVTPEFFETLGVSPQRGRTFANEAVTSPAVVLSDRLWRTELQHAADVIGSPIRIGERPRIVVGVMPKEFDFPTGTDIWVLMGTAPHSQANIQFVGRLRTGLSLGQAATELKASGYKRGEGPSGKIGKDGPVLQSLQVFLRGDQRPLLWILWAVSVLFLLLASAGSANLLLAQGVRRRPEMVLRLALGAGRWRLVRQLLTETLMVVVAGGLLGMCLSIIAGRWLRLQFPEMQEGQVFVPATVGLVAALAVAVTILSGLAPALHSTRANLNASLEPDVSRINVFLSRRRFFSSRELLATVQLALALVLLISTGLLLRSLTTRLNMPLGLQSQGVAVFSTDLPRLAALTAARENFFRRRDLDPNGSYGPRQGTLLDDLNRTLEPEQRAQITRNMLFFQEAQEHLRGLPDVASVGVLHPAPFTAEATWAIHNSMQVYKSNPRGSGDLPTYLTSIHGRASANAFDVLGIRILAGRAFTSADVSDERAVQEAASCRACTSPTAGADNQLSGVAIINEAVAQKFWPSESAIGKQFHDPPFPARTVVGMVSNFHQSGDNPGTMPAVYYPFTGISEKSSFVVKLRPSGSAEQFAADANRILNQLAPALPRLNVQSMQHLTAEALTSLRAALILLSCFSLMGTIVAGLGVYAAATLMAAARKREMGIRMALGASVTQISWLALSRSVRLAVVAVPVGLFAGWVLARNLSHLLFQVGASDPITYLASSAFLLAIVLAAGFLPALGAASTDPAAALRHE